MISLRGVDKSYRLRNGQQHKVLDNVSIEFPTGKNIGVLGLNGAGKSTLIRLLSGSENPDRGVITRSGHVSFTLGFSSIFHPDLTGRENVAFVSQIYGLAEKQVSDYVLWFSDLAEFYDNPVGAYSSGMLAKLAFGLCLAIDFDTYLIDEITEVGDGIFREKAAYAFRERAERSDMILVSHNADTIREYCDAAAVLHESQLTLYDSVAEATIAFNRICQNIGHPKGA